MAAEYEGSVEQVHRAFGDERYWLARLADSGADDATLDSLEVGTEGTIELRKYIDIAGRPGGDHLFIVDRKGTRHVECAGTRIVYGEQLRDDVLNRTETAMKQSHCFYATELALTAQAKAVRIAGKRPQERAA